MQAGPLWNSKISTICLFVIALVISMSFSLPAGAVSESGTDAEITLEEPRIPTGAQLSPEPLADAQITGNAFIRGTTTVRQLLTVDTPNWPAGTTFTYQWGYSSDQDYLQVTPIPGATGPSFRLTANQMGEWISVRVVATIPNYPTTISIPAGFVGAIAPVVTRISGPTRYETAGSVHQRFSATGGTLFIATGQNFPDALSVAPVAAKLNASLVFTSRNTLEPAAKAAILRQQPFQVVLVGRDQAISQATENQIIELVGNPQKVTRIGGADRYETSRDLFNKYFSDGSAKAVYLATGVDYPDALTAAPAAAYEQGAVILIPGKTADQNVELAIAAIRGQSITNVKASGGTSTITSSVFDKIHRSIPTAQRVGGNSRFETTVKINEIFPTTTEFVLIASGQNFADALVSAIPAGTTDSPIYLSSRDCLPNSTATAIGGQKYAERILIGGTSALATAIERLTVCR